MTMVYKKEVLPQKSLKNLILTTCNDVKYRYRLIKSLFQERVLMQQQNPGVEDEALPLPYAFIVAILKKYVHEIDTLRSPEKQGNSSKVFLLAHSRKKGYSVGILIGMKDYLITVYAIEQINSAAFYAKKISLYTHLQHIYFDLLDLDRHVEKIKEKQQKKIERMKKQCTVFYQDKTCQYLFRFTKHVRERRAHAKKARLTLPDSVVGDILKYLVHNKVSHEALLDSLKNVRKEKQIALIFYNRYKTHLIGLLAAFDVSMKGYMVVTVVTMYDEVPKEKNSQKLLFPKVERIPLYDYDLDPCMVRYEKEKEQKALAFQRELNEAKKHSSIVKVTSYDEYLEKFEDGPKLKKASIKKIKLRKIQVKDVNKSSSNSLEVVDLLQNQPNPEQKVALDYSIICRIKYFIGEALKKFLNVFLNKV